MIVIIMFTITMITLAEALRGSASVYAIKAADAAGAFVLVSVYPFIIIQEFPRRDSKPKKRSKKTRRYHVCVCLWCIIALFSRSLFLGLESPLGNLGIYVFSIVILICPSCCVIAVASFDVIRLDVCLSMHGALSCD